MPKSTSQDFIETKNAEANRPVWLYRVQIDSNPVNDLFIAESETNVDYFKDTNTPQTYTARPISHKGISENTDGEVDAVKVIWANVNREVQAYLEANDGLRGKKVTIRQVFRENLDDPAAHIQDFYYIDSVLVTPMEAEFTLTSKLDILEVMVPRRKFNRHFCPWRYRGEGCFRTVEDSNGFPTGTFTAPEDFEVNGADTCNKTLEDCERHKNNKRFGGFPGVPGKTVFTT